MTFRFLIMQIRLYIQEDENAVVALWEKCGLTRPWNNPVLDIERIMKVYPELFLVGTIGGEVMAAAMGGYDGHRGWVYYLAVDPEHQRQGYGKQMMEEIEKELLKTGCPKINLLIRGDNTGTQAFYDKIGYKTEDIISMGKRLIED